MKHNSAGKLEEMSYLQIQPGLGVWMEQVERNQNIVTVTNETSETTLM